ncbi:substrate-binding domain-containing protein [Telmatospirillum sp.]|uniref:substrate-binding domain-containing protein n=1 Tax=Telmatospirillum sp. TaxID=2079197 RepID=UPI00284182A6|nr:substrate-binding domain-containing protein [Telmatospirillum sp.]MDR3439665.1 substrate-binding domain-containing protein [Telmatospirillum sp.]
MTNWRDVLLRRPGAPEQLPAPKALRKPAAVAPCLGILLPNLANPAFGECIEGIEGTARAMGYSLLLAFTGNDLSQEDKAIEFLIGRGIAGLLLTVADAHASAALAELDRKRLPYVLIYNQLSHQTRSSVSIDNTLAARNLTETLIQHGHHSIGMVVASLQASDRSVRRLEGYRAALKAHGLPAGPIVEIPSVDIDAEDLQTRLQDALLDIPCPSAFFCASDMLALVTIRGLRKLGYRVPGGISVVGYDGIALGQLTDPPLAGVVQPHRELGEKAVSHLIERITGKAVPSALLLPHRIRLGGTLGRWTPTPGA